MATINISLAAGSVASPFFIDAKITKQLCAKTSTTPVFVPVFTLISYRLVGGTNQYEALVSVSGIVSYTPCGGCCAKSQTINETFTIPFVSAAAPTSVTITAGDPINTIITGNGCGKCAMCGNTFVSDVPLTLTVA